MNDILKTHMERFRENRHTLRRYTAFVLALAMITTLFVNWQLHGVGISMTAQYQCGEEEHTHTADCYERILICGYKEGDLENASEIAAAEAVITGEWDKNLLSVAKTQLGYEQSEKNFEIDPADGVTLRYYSRYGQSYGNPYGEWDVMFLSYCLKYAGIPQSAIPQEASVLSLRSAMSGMNWLLEEDGSAAQPGDIVIYNKYVTRTVAVDSSADGADPDLDDLFSVDTKPADTVDSSSSVDAKPADTVDSSFSVDAEPTDTVDDSSSVDAEFENSAELAEYDVSAPDIIPSTAYSASGADILTPSVVSPVAEPQTTTATDALPVETVGIVSEVDSDAGTLTVISGDVDGKVAEVALYDADVLAVVDVAAAQYASQLPTISTSRPNRVPALAAGTTYLDYFVETSEGTNKGGITAITVKQGTKVLNPGDQIELKDGDKLSLNYTFNIPENALKDLTTKTLTYRLPDGIELSENKSFPLVDQSTNQEVGTGVVDTDGVVQLTFNEEFDTSKPFTGHFDFEAEASTVGTQESNTIRFPTGLELIVKLPRDLAIEKKGSTPVVDSDGTTYIDYTVIVSSKDG